jgi:CBS domain-containing protein
LNRSIADVSGGERLAFASNCLESTFDGKHGLAMATRKVLNARVAGTQFEIPRHPRVEPLTVKSILQNKPSKLHCVRADATSLEALKLMAEHDIGAVLVLDGGGLIGIFSERDYAHSSIRTTQLTTATPVRELMTSCDVFANLTDSVYKCLSLMSENRLRYLPVQESGNLIAMLSLDDLLNEKVSYLEKVFKESELDQQIIFLRGTYSC